MFISEILSSTRSTLKSVITAKGGKWAEGRAGKDLMMGMRGVTNKGRNTRCRLAQQLRG